MYRRKKLQQRGRLYRCDLCGFTFIKEDLRRRKGLLVCTKNIPGAPGCYDNLDVTELRRMYRGRRR